MIKVQWTHISQSGIRWDPRGFEFEDPGHPNDEGHAVMFEIFWKQLEHFFVPASSG